MNSRNLRLGGILIPCLVMLGWIAMHRFQITTAEVKFEVVGYDPRDLLSGHYIRYRVVYGSDELCSTSSPHTYKSPEYCVCLTNGSDGFTRATHATDCDARGSGCGLFIRGICESGRFTAGIENFFLDELKAKQIAILPPHSFIKVQLTGTGAARVTSLWPGGQELKNYEPSEKR